MTLDKFKLDGKTALVTGASSGLGAAMATALAEAGADVICHCRNPGESDATCERIVQIGRRTVAVAGDVAERDVPAKLVESATREFGRIDILVNNAGMIRRTPAVDFSEEDWTLILEVKLSSVFRLSQAAGRKMIERAREKS